MELCKQVPGEWSAGGDVKLAGVFSGDVDPDVESVGGQVVGDSFGPLDQGNSRTGEPFLGAEVEKLASGTQAEGVGVVDVEPGLVVL